MTINAASNALGKNPNYLTKILRNDGYGVTANAQAKVGLRIENRWCSLMEALGLSTDSSSSLGGLFGGLTTGLQIFTGNNFLPLVATSHVWRGSNGLEIQLSMRFDAWDNPLLDVLLPVMTLIMMFSPIRQGGGVGDGAVISKALVNAIEGYAATPPTVTSTELIAAITAAMENSGQYAGSLFLHPPGPTPFEFFTKGFSAPMLINIMLGNVMYINDLIPVGIEWEFEERFVRNGNPIAANVNATFMNFTTPDLYQIWSWFIMNAG